MLAARTRFAGGGGAAVVLLLIVASTVATRAAVADDFFSPLSPLLAPVIGSMCKTVACGKGNCTAASGFPGYRCECEPGWKQMHVGDQASFLPCVIPNCSIDRACSNTIAPAPAPLPSPKNFSLPTDPCQLAYCGSGGTCKNGTGLSYHCECSEGFSNLLNITTMPCFQNCSIGADCASIGLSPSSNSSSSPAPPGSAGISNNGAISHKILLPLLILGSLMYQRRSIDHKNKLATGGAARGGGGGGIFVGATTGGRVQCAAHEGS
uniref:EGF-like domain-containing protein n=1 Tax=Oryza rufipogon TaxID=4529 RepID=A0A0E0NQ07_ORYRU